MKHSLSKNGLSLSQAQSISNLCNQRSRDIQNTLSAVNNVKKVIKIDNETYTETEGVPLPTNVIDLLTEKAKLHACQAFLMENIKEKDQMIRDLKSLNFQYDKPEPKHADLQHPEILQLVTEEWGWEQLTPAEYNEFLEAEAYAAHIGQFFHAGGKLDQLRNELPNIKMLEWYEVEQGKKTPVIVTVHHSAEALAELHETLATMHRNYEMRVNYFKSKVKNSVTAENARRTQVNAENQAICNQHNESVRMAFKIEYDAYMNALTEAKYKWEKQRTLDIQTVIDLRINVPERFKPVVDTFMKHLEN